jgi:ABC-type branched-subunit amino acid transport system permease subunit
VRVRAGVPCGITPRAVAALRADVVLDQGRRGRVAVPFASVVQLERSAGRGPCGAEAARWGCILGGGLVGALVGAVIGYTTTQGPGDTSGIDVLWGTLAGLVVGMLVGNFVGGERWERVPISGGNAPP